MKILVESMLKETFDNYFTDKKKDWGDQIDVYMSHVESEDLEGNKYCDVTFVRMPKAEFTSVDEVVEKAKIQLFSDNEYLKRQNDILNNSVNELTDMIIDLTEE